MISDNYSKKILFLTLKKTWFDLILKGDKTVENRIIKPYWTARLENKSFDIIVFRNGYGLKVPEMAVECKGVKKDYEAGKYRIYLGKVLSIKNYTN